MNIDIETLGRAVLIGIGATVVMDAWGLFQRRVLGIPTLNYALLGRWIGHFANGRFFHQTIAGSRPVLGELALGWAAHYLIGITFAVLLVAIWGEAWAARPTLAPALLIGLVTLAAPFLLLQPAFGYGVAASKTPQPNAARLRSLVTHTIYGVGLYLSGWFWAVVLPL